MGVKTSVEIAREVDAMCKEKIANYMYARYTNNSVAMPVNVNLVVRTKSRKESSMLCNDTIKTQMRGRKDRVRETERDALRLRLRLDGWLHTVR
jgi:hypothetical protein